MAVPEHLWRFSTADARASLAERFGAPNESCMQDWEWEVADSGRIGEHLDAYHNGGLSDDEGFTLMEAMIQAFEDLEDSLDADPTGLTILATTHIPSQQLIGPASISAAVLVALLAFAIRRSPSSQREGLSILAPVGCLLMAVYSSIAVHRPDVQHYVEAFIYEAASFSFAVHNFRFQSRSHWIYGSMCSFLSGAFIVLFCSILSIRGARSHFAEVQLICTSEAIFIVCWSACLYALMVHRRRQ